MVLLEMVPPDPALDLVSIYFALDSVLFSLVQTQALRQQCTKELTWMRSKKENTVIPHLHQFSEQIQ